MAQVSPTAAQGAPVQATMDRGELVARFGELCAEEGAVQYAKMKDGWRLKRESWRPAAAAKGVVLFAHGTGESTRTIGMRRLAHACIERGFILEAYDVHGHGESLEKNGKPYYPAGFRGAMLESTMTLVDHYVELAELVITEHRLPLVVMGHSGGGQTICLATDRVVELCANHGVPFVTGVYASPGIGVMANMVPCGISCCHYCVGCCNVGCCCNCCGKPVMKGGKAAHFNPDGVLGPENTGDGAVNCDHLWTSTAPYPKGDPRTVEEVAAHMGKLEQPSLIFLGSPEGQDPQTTEVAPRKNVEKLLKLVPALTLEVTEKPHDYLNLTKDGDLRSIEVVNRLIGFAEERVNALSA